MRRFGAGIALVACVLCGAVPALAQDGLLGGLQKSVESVFSTVSTTTTMADGSVVRTETTNVYPALRLNLDTNLYPNLRLNAGGVFEYNASYTRGLFGENESTITRNRPFILLRSTDPVISPGIGYFRREERARTAGLANVKLINDEYDAYLGWYPAGGPRTDVQFVHSNTYDGDRAFQDTTRDYTTVGSDYRRGNFGAHYGGSYLATNNRVEAFKSQQGGHAGRLNYSGAYLAQRLLWNALYNASYQGVTTQSSRQGGEVALPVPANMGLSASSDLPVTAKLVENTALVDSNLTAGAGVDLGLAAPGEEAQARNFGLDFVNRTEVNRLLVWVDRDLPPDVAGSFSWEIYSSDDNVVWRRETTVSGAPFGPFERRFEIDFSAVTARYVKVVTKPLSASVPDSTRYSDIFVTELQAFVRRTAGVNVRTFSQTNQLVNTDVRLRLLDSPTLFYEGFYLYNGSVGSPARTSTLSNGLSFNHAFSRIFSAYARGAYERGSEPRGARTATVSSATFTAEPVPALRSSLLYSGQDETVAGTPSRRHGLFLQTAAQPYRGVDLLVGFGWNFTTRENGEHARDRQVNVSGTIVPRRRVGLTISYDNTSTTRTGTFTGPPTFSSQRFYGSLTFDPLRTLHFVLGGEAFAATGERTRTTLDVGVNWAPFPDGTLQLLFMSNETLRPLDLGRESHTVGGVRWNASRQSFIDVSYQRVRTEYVFQTIDTRVFSVSVRLYF